MKRSVKVKDKKRKVKARVIALESKYSFVSPYQIVRESEKRA